MILLYRLLVLLLALIRFTRWWSGLSRPRNRASADPIDCSIGRDDERDGVFDDIDEYLAYVNGDDPA